VKARTVATYQNPYVVVQLIDGKGRTLGTGIARCSKADAFSPKLGTEIALTRAIANFYDLQAESAVGADKAWRRNGWPSAAAARQCLRRLRRKYGLERIDEY
jgi:hypothetical protein